MQDVNWTALIIFVLLFAFITWLGFAAARWRRGDLDVLHEWGLGGRRFGTVITWFLVGGDVYTAYTFIAVPALAYGAGAVAFFAVPYTVMIYPLLFLAFPRLWNVCRKHHYITAADFVHGRFGNRWLALAVAITGIIATLPYIALQLVGLQVVIGGLGVASTGYTGDLPLLIAFVIAFVMLTWRKGEEIMDMFRLEVREPTKEFIERLNSNPPLRVPGTAVVLGRMAKGVPLALSHNVRCNHVLYENVLLVAVTTTETPRVSDEDGVAVTPIADGITRVELRFGFMEQPDVPKALEAAMARGQIAKCDLSRVIYYTGHETIIPSGRRPGLARWREELFAFMHHNAQRPGAYFKIPSSQIMEIGVEFEI